MSKQLCRGCEQTKPVCCGSGKVDDDWCLNYCAECCPSKGQHSLEEIEWNRRKVKKVIRLITYEGTEEQLRKQMGYSMNEGTRTPGLVTITVRTLRSDVELPRLNDEEIAALAQSLETP